MIWMTPKQNADKIAALNDAFRKTLRGGIVVLTPSVENSPHRDSIIETVRSYKFHGIDENNPYGQSDFGTVTVSGTNYFFKIDYYDLQLEYHSLDASDPKVTKRVLTIMKAEEY
jgi:hypothetical protein